MKSTLTGEFAERLACANSHRDEGRLAGAFDGYNWLLVRLRDTNDAYNTAEVLWLVGVTWSMAGQYPLANSALQNARNILIGLGLTDDVRAVDRDIARVLYAEGKLDEASNLLRELTDPLAAAITESTRADAGWRKEWTEEALRGWAVSRALLAEVLAFANQHDQADAALEYVNGMFNTVTPGDSWFGLLTCYLSELRVAILMGDVLLATNVLCFTWELAEKVGDGLKAHRRATIHRLSAAFVCVVQGDKHVARERLEHAEALMAEQPEVDRSFEERRDLVAQTEAWLASS